ncbi:ImmA/IrrE family metallo-endopeptidase [Glutamicibacter sp. NPDC087344]|uniref:ImmA/IrrE family metallo-endopeptidase n=1 Tax=Glutamicibacter sp. NPDC087344 TaxID=3363994 RepID=UPI00380C1DE6
MIHSLSSWGVVRELATSLIVWSRPHSTVPAFTDGKAIYVDPDLAQDETLCALVHELIHLERGHKGCQPPTVERDVQLEAARRLISFEDLQRVAGWSKCPEEMADELGVTEEFVILRIQTLNGDQVQTLWPPSEFIA